MPSFNNLEVSKAVIKATEKMGFEEMTPIQELAIPVAISGRDIIGQAQTGTGKTAAFGIPMIEKSVPAKTGIQGLVLTPTRELAVQVAEEINSLGEFKRIRALPIYGGQSIDRQIKSLKSKPHIIVATPGRLMDHMRRRLIRLEDLQFVVLDEADEMLNMGFRDDIETILSEAPHERQTMLFSATMPNPIMELGKRYMRDPEMLKIKTKELTVPNTKQYYYLVQEKEKFDAICRLLDLQAPESAIVFARTKRRVDEIHEAMLRRGFLAEAIHGDLNQSKRDTVMRKFKKGLTEILVATDVAARGLDIGSVTHIYNFDIPQDAESYVHRIGRTGRIGKPGIAITFAVKRELDHLYSIEKAIKKKIEHRPVPTANEALEGLQKLSAEKLTRTVEDNDLDLYKELARELLRDTDEALLIAAALKLLTREPDFSHVEITADGAWTPKSARSTGRSYRSDNRAKSYSRKGRRKYKKHQ